jgi:hypothetical protein
MSDSKHVLKVLIINESDAKSVLSDLFTFGVLMLCFWLNYKYVGGDAWLSAFLFFGAFIWAINRSTKLAKRMNPIEARDYLNAMYPPAPETPSAAKATQEPT